MKRCVGRNEDLTLTQVINRRDGLSLSRGRGYEIGFFSI